MKRVVFVIFAAAIFLGMVCSAQAIDSPFIIDNVPNVVGVGGGAYPDYLGSDNYTAGAAPFFRWTFTGQQRYLQFLVTELSLNVLDDPTFAFGPVLNYRFGRNDDVEDHKVRKMEEIDDTVEAGAFASYTWKDTNNPRHRFIASLEGLFDVGGEYDGWTAMANARYWFPVSKPIDLLIGVGTTYGNSQYMNTYFGVSSDDAARAGLKKFEADGGFRDVNAQFAAVFHFSMNWHLGVGVKYFDLVSDAADSPIVDKRGDANQFVYGLGLAYSW
jgi:outer membrane protein